MFFNGYSRATTLCDTDYLSDSTHEENPDFIRLDDGTCYEIMGVSDTILTYRHTISGTLYVLHTLRR